MKKFILFLMIFSPMLLVAQVTKTWNVDAGDWDVAANWDPMGVPTAIDEIVITGSNSHPTIAVGTAAVAKSIELKSSADLTIMGGLTLGAESGSTTNGALDIDTGGGVVTVAIGATITVTNATERAINVKGTVENNGAIDIDGATDAIYTTANGTFNNNAGAILNITNASGDHIAVREGTTGGTAFPSTFNNSGQINITMAGGDEGIYVNDGSSFVNSGVISITATLGDIPLHIADQLGTSPSVFDNQATGELTITGAVDFNIQVDGDNDAMNNAKLDNAGTIEIIGGSDDGMRIRRGGVVNNLAGGSFSFVNTGKDGIQIDGVSELNNAGVLSIDGTGAGEEALELNGVGSAFHNLTGGLYMVDNCADDGIEVNNGSIFTNDGDIRIDNSAGEDIETFGVNTITNMSNATYAPGSSPGDFVIKGDFDLGASTTTFEITGLTPTTEFDQILNTVTANTLTVSAATAHLDWGAYVPAIGDCFKIIDGSGAVGGPFATITSSNAAIAYEVTYPTGEVIICIVDPLPVELVSFTGEKTDRGSDLNWITASEENNEGFEIERSNNGSDWTKIGYVQGNGTSSELMQYTFLDAAPTEGTNYYRLKQNDFDGKFDYSKTVTLNYRNEKSEFIFYPNPAHNVLTYEGSAGTLTIYDVHGRQIMQQTTNSEKTNFDISQLEVGVYIIEMTNNSNEKSTKRFIKK